MHVTESQIALEVTLGFLLKMFKTKFVERPAQLRHAAVRGACHTEGHAAPKSRC
jgi:hypothetical protein